MLPYVHVCVSIY